MDSGTEETAAGAGASAVAGEGMRERVASLLNRGAGGDRVAILSGTGQNLAGLAVYVLASLGTNVLVSRALGASALGIVTLTTQLAFVGGAATRFGMDMAAVRLVAIDVGKGEPGRARGVLSRAAAVAAGASLVVLLAIAAASGSLARVFGGSPSVFVGAAVALPFVALCQVYLGGTRGLKIMRHTLYVYWAGQPVVWIVLMLGAWFVSRTPAATVFAYAASWLLATAVAWWLWQRETRAFRPLPPERGDVSRLIRYGAPRAPAALLAQLLFWTDYFVVAHYEHGGDLGVYAAAIRVAQALVLFLVAVNYMFSPFVADLHARGERAQLDGLYKSLTRWVVAGTLPILLVLAIAPEPVLRLFGSGFQSGSLALRILLVGQAVNVATGSVGFILVMVGRTGWDLLVYAASFVLDLAIAILLVPHLHAAGGAIAQATTLAVSNGAGLYLVWRFVRIQPFDREYARLIVPAVAAALVMGLVHLALHHGAWAVDLLATAVVGALAYAALLLVSGLTPGERAAARWLLAAARRR